SPSLVSFLFFQAEDGIRDFHVTGVQTCALPISRYPAGAIIERKGEKAYAWMGVLAGLVKVSVGNVDGKMASLTGVPPGGWIGEEIGRATCRERGTSAAAGASTSDMTPSVRWCDE